MHKNYYVVANIVVEEVNVINKYDQQQYNDIGYHDVSDVTNDDDDDDDGDDDYCDANDVDDNDDNVELKICSFVFSGV